MPKSGLETRIIGKLIRDKKFISPLDWTCFMSVHRVRLSLMGRKINQNEKGRLKKDGTTEMRKMEMKSRSEKIDVQPFLAPIPNIKHSNSSRVVRQSFSLNYVCHFFLCWLQTSIKAPCWFSKLPTESMKMTVSFAHVNFAVKKVFSWKNQFSHSFFVLNDKSEAAEYS